MESSKEFEGRDLESAIQIACNALNLSPADIRYDILSRGSTGVFGFVGVRKARIRVLLPVPAETDPETKAPPTSVHFGAKSIVDEAFSDLKPAMLNPEVKDDAERLLKYMVNAIVDDAVVEAGIDKERILFNIKCPNPSALIGKHGQTIEAIQYLMDKMTQKKSATSIQIQVDVDGYIERRTSNLTTQALRMAEKAKKTGKPATINQMNAHDRRIIHLALKDDGDVKTQSMGNGYYRKLIIFPKRAGGRKPRQHS